MAVGVLCLFSYLADSLLGLQAAVPDHFYSRRGII